MTDVTAEEMRLLSNPTGRWEVRVYGTFRGFEGFSERREVLDRASFELADRLLDLGDAFELADRVRDAIDRTVEIYDRDREMFRADPAYRFADPDGDYEVRAMDDYEFRLAIGRDVVDRFNSVRDAIAMYNRRSARGLETEIWSVNGSYQRFHPPHGADTGAGASQ